MCAAAIVKMQLWGFYLCTFYSFTSFFVWKVESAVYNSAFSGFYIPVENEQYAGAFLISKDRLVNSSNRLAAAWFPEDVIFKIVKFFLKPEYCVNCSSLFLRDYLDFSIEHLSSSTNIVSTMSTNTQVGIMKMMSANLNATINSLKREGTSEFHHRQRVVGVIPYTEEIANPNDWLPPDFAGRTTKTLWP